MWKSKRVGDKYLIQDNDSKFPYEVNKPTLDWHLSIIRDDLKNLREDLKEFHKLSPYEFNVVATYSYLLDKDNAGEGEFYFLESIYEDVKDLEEMLSTDDEIKSKEDLITLEDIGFVKVYSGTVDHFYSKFIDCEFNIGKTKEVYVENGKIIHRLRTIKWKEVEGGRESESIEYEYLPVDDELKQIVENTIGAKLE